MRLRLARTAQSDERAAYSCKPEGCLEPVPYPAGCFPVANVCADFFGEWSLSYAMWERRAGDELDDAGADSNDAGAEVGDVAVLKRCEETTRMAGHR